jgi:hypothetical protein
MFDQLVFPILSYGSGIWVAQDLEKLLRMDYKPRIEKIFSKLLPKNLNTLFCKYILGVGAKTTNIADMGE